jgi:hypothetical protein
MSDVSAPVDTTPTADQAPAVDTAPTVDQAPAPVDPAPAVDTAPAPAVADAGAPAVDLGPLEARVAQLEADAAAPAAYAHDPKGPGSVVFFEVYDAYADSGAQELTHAGLVVAAADGRVRILDLGPLARTADLPGDAVRVDA